jgi:hypothetical protein
MIYPTRDNPRRDQDGNEAYIEHHRLLKLKLKHEMRAPRIIGVFAQFARGVLEVARYPNHYYRIGRGFGFSAGIFEHHVEFGIVRVRLIAHWFNPDDGKPQSLDVDCEVERLISNFQQMTKYKKQGFEKQMLVREEFFRRLIDEREKPGPAATKERDSDTRRIAGGQLTLF